MRACERCGSFRPGLRISVEDERCSRCCPEAFKPAIPFNVKRRKVTACYVDEQDDQLWLHWLLSCGHTAYSGYKPSPKICEFLADLRWLYGKRRICWHCTN